MNSTKTKNERQQALSNWRHTRHVEHQIVLGACLAGMILIIMLRLIGV